jgi:Flp pilus assembly protein TadB
MSKERAQRRAERLAVAEREKAKRARRVARRLRRQDLVRRLTPQRRRSGQVLRRSRGERIGIVVVAVLVLAAVWALIPDLALRLVLTVLLALVLGRRY